MRKKENITVHLGPTWYGKKYPCGLPSNHNKIKGHTYSTTYKKITCHVCLEILLAQTEKKVENIKMRLYELAPHWESNSSQNRAGLISKQFTQLADIFYEDDKKAEIYSELASLFMSSNIK